MFAQPFPTHTTTKLQPDFYGCWPSLFLLISYLVIGFWMQVMQELGLIGLRIQRMPSEPDLEFGIPSQYGYMTVR